MSTSGPSSRTTPGASPTAHLSPLGQTSARISPLPSPNQSFNYRRFSASTSRISDERGSISEKTDAPEDAIEDELDEKTPAAASRDRSLSGTKEEKPGAGPVSAVRNGRWAAGYGDRWKVGFGPSNERGGDDESDSVPSRMASPAVTPVSKKEEEGSEMSYREDEAQRPGEVTPPPSARKRKRGYHSLLPLTSSHSTRSTLTSAFHHFSCSPTARNMSRRWSMQRRWRQSRLRRMPNLQQHHCHLRKPLRTCCG